MSSEGSKAETGGFNHGLSVSRETLFLASASLRWWDMATPRAVLQAVLDRSFELVGNGWVPVNAQSGSAPNRWCQAAIPPNRRPWKLRPSPVKLLFKGRVDLDKVCGWFMHTTETRSLTIASCRKHLEVPRAEGLGSVRRQEKGRARGQPRARVRRQPRTRPRPPALGKDLWKKAAGELGANTSFVDNRTPGIKRRRVGWPAGGWNQRNPGRDNWWSRKPVHRKHRKRQRATPTPSPQGHQKRKGDKTSGEAEYPTCWGAWESPPVLSVKGTDYKLVPVGNTWPALEKMQDLDATGASQLHSASARPGTLLGGAKWHLGCLRECWVLLRNIEGGSQRLDPGHRPPPPGKVNQRKARRWTPARKPRGQTRRPVDNRVAQGHRPLPPNPAEVPEPATDRGGHLPAFQSLPACPVQRENPARSPERGSSPVQLQQEVKWQVACLKECRVILRKIKPLAANQRNDFAVHPPLKLSSQHLHLDQDLENTEGNSEVEPHVDPYGTDSYSCEENQNVCLATIHQDADVSALVKVQGSTTELASAMKFQEKGTRKQMKDTFTDTNWKLGGLKECSVVLKKITPLDGNPFISLAGGQLFRLGLNDIKDKSNRQEL